MSWSGIYDLGVLLTAMLMCGGMVVFKQRLCVAHLLGVLGAALLWPVFAALAAVIGVLVLLAYGSEVTEQTQRRR